MHPWGKPWHQDPRVSRVTAELGGLSWVGRPHAGPCFLLRSLTGWWGGGTVSGGAAAHTTSDGTTRGDTYLHNRIITLRGLILTDSGAQQFEAFDALTASVTRDRWLPLTVSEAERGIARQVTVTPVSLPDPQPISDLAATVSLTVESDDWPLLDVREQRKVVTPAGVTLQNSGTVDANVIATLRGPLTTPGLTWPGGSFRYATLASSQVRRIDMGREVAQNPSTGAWSAHLVTGDWLTLPPGSTTVKRTGGGAGSIELAWRSTWA